MLSPMRLQILEAQRSRPRVGTPSQAKLQILEAQRSRPRVGTPSQARAKGGVAVFRRAAL